MSDAHGMQMDTQTILVVALCGSVILVGLWLSQLVLQAVYRARARQPSTAGTRARTRTHVHVPWLSPTCPHGALL